MTVCLTVAPFLSAHASDICSAHPFPYLTFPVSGQAGDITPLDGCFKGKSIVSSITDDENASLTSALKLPDREIFYVTSYDPQSDKTKMSVVFQTAQGRVFDRDLLSDASYGRTPEKTFNGMRIVAFIQDKNLLVVETNGWAQSGAIHILYVPPENPLFEGVVPWQKFITAGNFVSQPLAAANCPACLLVSTIGHDSEGAYFPTKLVTLKGKEVCQVDTRKDDFRFSPVCIRPGEVLKPRQ